MRPVLSLVPLVLLAGCAGYAADYWKSKPGLVASQLGRYGLGETATRCVAERLADDLTVWQLRQLADTSERVRQASLTTHELRWVSKLVNDPAVAPALDKALAGCGVGTRIAVAPVSAPKPAAPVPVPSTTGPTSGSPPAAVTPAAPGASVWLNLGVAATGQAIAVDASSVENGPGYRKGWFRMTNPEAGKPGDIAYLLKIDCTAKTITPMGGRKYDASGAVIEEKAYGPDWEGALPIEEGTVMEIAYRSLCS